MELKGREIFAVGKWNEMNFTEADLDDIVSNFEALNAIHRVPLKFGHNDEQPLTDGQPAIGWISRVFREGKKLYADFTDMPNTVFEAIKKKLYRTVSVELLFDVDHQGKRFGHVLDAVALLGADHPAVNTLSDLDALLATRSSFAGGRRLCFETIAGKKTGKTQTQRTEEPEMDSKELKQFVADAVATAVQPLKDSLEDVTKDRDQLRVDLDAANKKQTDFEADQKKQKIVAARKTVTEILDAAVRDKHLTPAMREVYSTQIGVDDDESVLGIDIEQVKLMCNVTKVGKTDEEGKRNKGDDLTGDASKDLTAMTHAFMAEHGEKSFTRALTAVARANPDLHQDWLDSNREQGA